MSEGGDARRVEPERRRGASPGSAGVCVGTGTVEDARFCWASAPRQSPRASRTASASAWGADPAPRRARRGTAAAPPRAAPGTPRVRVRRGRGIGPGVPSVPASKSTQSTREGVRLLVGAAWSTGGALPSTAAANGSTAAVSSSGDAVPRKRGAPSARTRRGRARRCPSGTSRAARRRGDRRRHGRRRRTACSGSPPPDPESNSEGRARGQKGGRRGRKRGGREIPPATGCDGGALRRRPRVARARARRWTCHQAKLRLCEAPGVAPTRRRRGGAGRRRRRPLRRFRRRVSSAFCRSSSRLNLSTPTKARESAPRGCPSR